jgi:flagellar hook protein FlgE
MTSGVSAISALQSGMDVIGNNIANVNTSGFKSSRTTFRDVYYQTLSGASQAGTQGGSNPSQIGYGSQLSSVDVVNTRGGFVSTGLGTDCYIDGEGYYVVQDGSGKKFLTQVGTFSFDGSGNLVDGNKNKVIGFPYAGYTTDKVTVGGATIDFGKDNLSKYDLDGYTLKVVYSKTADSSVVADIGKKTITVTYKQEQDATTNEYSSLTKNGLQTLLQGTWTWQENGGTPTTTPSITTTDITIKGGATGDATANDVVPADASGTVNNSASFNTDSLTPIVNTYGTLKNVTISADGIITGQDTNGKIQSIGQIAVAYVPNPNALSYDGNSYFSAGVNTGDLVYSVPGENSTGKLKTGGLAGSNVDLANEFSNMIVTQRAYQANSKIITVSDEMLETLVNMKR